MIFIIHDQRCNNYIDCKTIDTITNLFSFSQSKDLNEEEFNFLIINNLVNQVLLINLKEKLKHNDWSEETIKKVSALTQNIPEYNLDTKTALKTFEILFNKETGINIYLSVAIKRLIKD